MWKSSAPPSSRAARTSTMSGEKRRRAAASATPWDGVDGDSLRPAQRIVRDCHRDIYRYRHAHADLEGEADFFNGYPRESCPRCGSPAIVRMGSDSAGVRRWLCRSCGRSFTPMTGTIFEGHKLPVADWTEFLLEVFSYESIKGMTRSNRRSDTTIPYWFAKLFAVLEGVQDGTVLAGRVQVDETFYPLALADQPRRPDGTRMRGGYSRGRICIGIGCDGRGSSVFRYEGLGKTSGAKTMRAFGSNIERGSTLAHDSENGHNRLVRELALVDERYDAKEIKRLPDKDNPLREVNRLCFLLKLFLDSHAGFDRDDIVGYLDVFSVMMNPPSDKMEKAAKVLDRAMLTPKSLSFRDFYGINKRSGRG